MKTYAELVTDDILQMERWPPSIRSSSRVTCWNGNETKQSSRWHTDRQLKWACHLLICFSSTPAWVPISVLLFLSLSFRQTHGWAVVLLFPVIMPFFSHHLWLSFLVFGSVFLHSNFFSPAAGCYYLKWSCRKKNENFRLLSFFKYFNHVSLITPSVHYSTPCVWDDH